jgi:DNA invertase Pin-like site-specific DNA recombinase
MRKIRMPLAYSYLRFSSPQQSTGDSIRRQTQSRESWLAGHPGVELDKSLVMTDSGRSAFRRKNWDTYALARFVECIKSGRVEKDSYLLVENLDRLSREDAGEATELFLSIVNKGVVVVQLSPVVMEFRRPVNVQSLMFAIVELSRGHSESAIKSERGKAFWTRKQREAGSRIVTRKLPGWINCEGGKLVLDRDHAETVRRVFQMARDGYGTAAIAERLNEDRVPIMGRAVFKGKAVKWSAAVVYHMLRTRTTIGEYLPYKKQKPNGSAVANYFPAVVDEDTFHAAQAAIATRSRRTGRGRRGNHVNLFSGLLVDARDGGQLSYWHTGNSPAKLIPVNAKDGRGGEWSSFPSVPFEDAILSKLVEIKASEIKGDGSAGKKVESLAGQLAEVDQLIKVWTAKMDNPAIVDTVATKLAEYSEKRKALAAKLSDAQRAAASPVSEAWGEFKSLADILRDDNSDDLRVKTRAALRRSIDAIYCVFSSRGSTRLAAVQVRFAGTDSHRDYVIRHTPRGGNGVREWQAITDVMSFASAGTGPLDFRKTKDVTKVLNALDMITDELTDRHTLTAASPRD